MELIGILECCLNRDSVLLALKIHHIVKHLVLFVQILDKTNDTLFLMIYNMFHFRSTFILINNRQCRVQVCRLMHTAFYFVLFESGLFKNLRIRKKIDLRTGFFRFSNGRKKPVFQFHHRNTTLITIVMNVTIPADPYIHMCRQCIYNRRTYSMQSSTGLISGIIKLSSCMKRRINNTRS